MDEKHIETIARVGATIATEAIQAERTRARERIYGKKQIAAAAGVSRVQLDEWVKRKGFPMDRDPRGYSVSVWHLERWFEAHRVAVESFRKAEGK